MIDRFPHHTVESWFVLRTRSRQEKILAGEFRAGGIATFLPLLTCTKDYGVLRGDADQAHEAALTRRVARIVEVADQDRLASELLNINLALCGSAPLDPHPYLHTGVRAEVRSGPFCGLQGVIEPVERRDCLILQVEILGRAVSIEIESSLLDVIDQ